MAERERQVPELCGEAFGTSLGEVDPTTLLAQVGHGFGHGPFADFDVGNIVSPIGDPARH
jgi:hypothetical protein